MTAAERLLWMRVQDRARDYAPAIREAILAAFRLIAEQMTEAEIVRAITFGRVDLLFREAQERAARELAYQQVRQAIRRGIIDGVAYYARDLPRGGRINGRLVVAFDTLNPRVIDAIRTLETRVIQTLDDAIVQTVKQAAEEGLKAGVHPRTVARGLRQVIGLAPNQEREVANYRTKLEHAHERLDALDNELRDHRFDGTVRKARETGKPIPPEKIDKMVEAYRKRRIAQNAETNARTAALDAQKIAQRLSWEDAIAKGIVSRDRMRKTWIGVLDDRERETHRKMEGVTVGFDETFVLPDGQQQQIPGDTEFNCRCIARYARR